MKNYTISIEMRFQAETDVEAVAIENRTEQLLNLVGKRDKVHTHVWCMQEDAQLNQNEDDEDVEVEARVIFNDRE